jgi:hypothetical protein
MVYVKGEISYLCDAHEGDDVPKTASDHFRGRQACHRIGMQVQDSKVANRWISRIFFPTSITPSKIEAFQHLHLHSIVHNAPSELLYGPLSIQSQQQPSGMLGSRPVGFL